MRRIGPSPEYCSRTGAMEISAAIPLLYWLSTRCLLYLVLIVLRHIIQLHFANGLFDNLVAFNLLPSLCIFCSLPLSDNLVTHPLPDAPYFVRKITEMKLDELSLTATIDTVVNLGF